MKKSINSATHPKGTGIPLGPGNSTSRGSRRLLPSPSAAHTRFLLGDGDPGENGVKIVEIIAFTLSDTYVPKVIIG